MRKTKAFVYVPALLLNIGRGGPLAERLSHSQSFLELFGDVGQHRAITELKRAARETITSGTETGSAKTHKETEREREREECLRNRCRFVSADGTLTWNKQLQLQEADEDADVLHSS